MSDSHRRLRLAVQLVGAALILVSGIHGLIEGATFVDAVSVLLGCLLLGASIRNIRPSRRRALQINSRTYFTRGLGWFVAGLVGLVEGLTMRGLALPLGIVAWACASYAGVRMLWASFRH